LVERWESGQRGELTQRLLGHLPRNVRTDWAQVAREGADDP
jgi:hypothetical protein